MTVQNVSIEFHGDSLPIFIDNSIAFRRAGIRFGNSKHFYLLMNNSGVFIEIERKDMLIEKLTANLPVLRTMLHLYQSDFAKLLGMSRQQVVAIENKKRKMT